MLGYKVPSSRRIKDEGEKPFWISFADLMTAMMILFLVVMSVAMVKALTKKPETMIKDPIPKALLDYEQLLHTGTYYEYACTLDELNELKSIKDPVPKELLTYEQLIHKDTYNQYVCVLEELDKLKTIKDPIPKELLTNEKTSHEETYKKYIASLTEIERLKNIVDEDKSLKKQRVEEIHTVFDRLKKDATHIKSCNIELIDQQDSLAIVFSSANPLKIAMFDSGEYRLKDMDKQCIREFVPSIYAVAHNTPWFDRVSVEGFTDTNGTYLLNLNLSLQRAQSVVCSVLTNQKSDATLSNDVINFVKEKFIVGGYSFNSAKKNKEESRRVELRLDFKSVEEFKHLQKPLEDNEPKINNEIGICAQQ